MPSLGISRRVPTFTDFPMHCLYTIGHSAHTFEQFASHLASHGINCVVDVRSSPYSRIHYQFNQADLKFSLHDRNTTYLHLGQEFGARRDSPELLRDGYVDFELVAKTEVFQRGITRLYDGMKKNFQIALMCAESDPL